MDELGKARRGLRIAQVVLCVQVVGALLALIAQLLEIASWLERGRDVSGAVWLMITINLVVIVSTAVGAALLLTRRWARRLCTVLQCIGFGLMLIDVIAGYWLGVVALVLAGVAIRQILVHGPVVDKDQRDGDRR